MIRLLTGADVIVKKGCSKHRKRLLLEATRVDDFDKLVLSHCGR